MTDRYYEYYLEQKKRIILEMENHNAPIFDIADNYSREEFATMGTLYQNEYRDYTEKQIARKLAEDQTYYLTSPQAEVAKRAIENYWRAKNIPMSERVAFSELDIALGTQLGRQLHAKYYPLIWEYERELIAAGMSKQEANIYIRHVIWGSP